MDSFPNKSSFSRSGAVSQAPRTEVPLSPKFIILHSANDTPLAKLSPFFLEKAIHGHTRNIKSIRKMRSGDLLVETSSNQASDILLKAKNLAHIPINVSVHKTLNSSRGVISTTELLNMSVEELEHEFAVHGITQVRRITIRKDGKQIPTKHLILTFNSPHPPTSVKAGYLHCPVRPYIPNPMRCYNCQKFGHSSQACRGKSICPKCSLSSHGNEACSGPINCANCNGDHPAYSRSCPRWQREKAICSVMATQSLPYKEASKQIKEDNQQTYASVTKTKLVKETKPTTNTIGTQTDVSCHPSETFTISLTTVTKEHKKSTKSQYTNTDDSQSGINTNCNTASSSEQTVNCNNKKSPPLVKQKLFPKCQKPQHKIIRPPTDGNTPANSKDSEIRASKPNDTPRKETLRKKSPDPD